EDPKKGSKKEKDTFELDAPCDEPHCSPPKSPRGSVQKEVACCPEQTTDDTSLDMVEEGIPDSDVAEGIVQCKEETPLLKNSALI
ncbi:hypothetical protein PJO48_29755, partial [Mycobacterium kansasii]